jgi:hypothetical protein
MKTEVYSWRVSTELKTVLEREARRRKISLATALDLAAHDWIEKIGLNNDVGHEQRRLQEAASKFLGAIAGGDANRSENARRTVRVRLQRQHGR